MPSEEARGALAGLRAARGGREFQLKRKERRGCIRKGKELFWRVTQCLTRV